MEQIERLRRTKIDLSWAHSGMLWGAGICAALAMMVTGWARAYPVWDAPAEGSPVDFVPTLFWAGLWLCLASLVGWVVTTPHPWVCFLASALYVAVISSPQLLFLSWGPDAGSIRLFGDYLGAHPHADLAALYGVNLYFQWPGSMLFQRFLADSLGMDGYRAAQLGFMLVCVCVASGLYGLWTRGTETIQTCRAAFFGIALYFAGFFWFLNWQAVPYTFGLALFLPSLALVESRSAGDRVFFLLLLMAGMESHPLVGLWLVLILFSWVLLQQSQRTGQTSLLNLFWIVLLAQSLLMLYKNTPFFLHLINTFQGFYENLLARDSTDQALFRSIALALQSEPENPAQRLMKALAAANLAVTGLVFAGSLAHHLARRKPGEREVSFGLAGLAHFIVGMRVPAIGTRALQLIGLAPGYFITTALQNDSRWGRWIRIGCVIAILLFPASLYRSLMGSEHFVKPYLLAPAEFLNRRIERLADWTILGEAASPIDLQKRILHPSAIGVTEGCVGRYVLINTLTFRKQVERAAGGDPAMAGGSTAGRQIMGTGESIFYDSGFVTMLTGEDCAVNAWMWK